MQLSSKARKAVAFGLAASTILWGSVGLIPSFAAAAVHTDGCLVLSGGVVWMITSGTRRGFTSAEVFQSYGYNFSQVVQATAEDVALPAGPVMTYADSTLVKGPNDALVYLVSGNQKRPFVSGAVFTGLGYSFANVQQAPVNTFSDLPTGSNLDNASAAHPNGALVISNGTIWQMTATGHQGFPTMAAFDSFGYKLSAVVTANAADVALPDQGAVAARPGCSTSSTTPPVSGSLTVSLSGPASTTLINDESLATLANFVFTGTATVTGVTLKRTGISADTTLSNVYLFDGTTRLTDAASVSSGSVINFSNSAGVFTVAGSRTVSVRADMNGSAGETVGVQLTAVTLSSGSVSGLPVSGNNHTIATASLAAVDLASALTISDTDPGKDIIVFQGNASVTTREVTLTRLALRQIGSIVNTDIKNFRFYVDGVETASQSALDANGYVTFTMFKSLGTGTRVLKVVADIIGGSGRTVQMSLRGAYDITVIDTQYNAAPLVTATGSFPFGDSTTFAINAGTITAPKATDSPSSNVTIGASDVPLGRWTVTAFGEAVKIETLTIAVDVNGTDANNKLRNGRIMIQGAQYGSTTDVTAVDAFATGQSFTVNYMVQPGTPVTVEFRADMYDSNTTSGDDIGDGTTTSVQVSLIGSGSSNNAIPQVSLGTLDVPGSNQNANALTITSGTIALVATSNYPAQTTSVPQTAYKMGSFTLTGNSTEAVNVNTIAVGFVGADEFDPSSDLTNVYLKIGSTTSTIKGTISDGSATDLANSWSQGFTLEKSGSVTIELYASIASTAGDGTGDTMTSYMRVTGVTAQSGLSVYADTDSDTDNADAGATGQVITVGTGTVTISQDASAPTSKLIDDAGVVVVQAYKIAAVTDSFTVTDLALTMGSATAVSGVVLKDGSTVVGSSKIGTSITWSGMEISIPANQSKILTVEVTMSPIGYLAGTSDSSLIATLVSFTARNSAGTSATSTGAVVIESPANFAGNSIYAYRAIPTISSVALPDSNLAGGNGVVIAKFTVSSGGTGTIAWKQAMFEISKSAADILANPVLYNSDTGEQVTAAVEIGNGTTGVATTCSSDNITCEFLMTVGTDLDDNTVEAISGAKTYELRADISGTIASTDHVSVKLDRNTTTHTGKNVFTTVENAGDSGSAGGPSFIWSDESASATSDTGVTTWNDDYLVKNLPLTWNLN